MTMRVGIYTPYSPSAPGAAGMRVHYLEEALRERGMQPITVTPKDAKGWRLCWHFLKMRPHAIISTSPPLPPNGWIWLAASLCGATWILDAKDDGRALALMRKEHPTLRERAFLFLRTFLYHRAARIWFLTALDMEEATHAVGVNPSRTMLVPNGTDARIVFDAETRKSTRKRLHLSPGTRVGIYAGSLGDEEISPLIDALHEHRKRNDFFLIMIVSSDDSPADQERMRATQEKLITQLGKESFHLEKNIPIHAMSAWLSAADVGFIPWPDALPSSLPVKAFDYAATGLPILAKCPGHGALAAWMRAHPESGIAISEWKSFRSALGMMLKRTPTLRQRSTHATEAHRTMDRSTIMRQAVKAIFFPHGAEKRAIDK